MTKLDASLIQRPDWGEEKCICELEEENATLREQNRNQQIEIFKLEDRISGYQATIEEFKYGKCDN